MSTKPGSTSRVLEYAGHQVPLLADKLEDLRKTGEVTVHPEEERDKIHCPKCGLRLLARRVMPALPAAKGDREPALAAPAAAVADGPGDVLA